MDHHLPARPHLDDYRRRAKSLVRAFRAGDPAALERARDVLGERARERFLLSDAQFVVAREQQHRSWAELKHALEARGADPGDRLQRVALALAHARAGWGELGEVVLDGGVAYVEADRVLVRVRKRGSRYTIDDDGGAVARAGRPPGWLVLARRVAEDEYWLNVNRRGTVFVPAVERAGDGVAGLVLRVADASAAVYEGLLELDRE